jgi:hypothetical protein
MEKRANLRFVPRAEQSLTTPGERTRRAAPLICAPPEETKNKKRYPAFKPAKPRLQNNRLV